MSNTGKAILEASDLVKIYKRGTEEIHAVNHISLSIRQGESVAFIGPSGSGKTTLINLIGCLDNPTSGLLRIREQVVAEPGRNVSENQLTRIRRETFGYIFQKFYLVPTLTVRENILLPFAFFRKPEINDRLFDLAHDLGLEKRMHHLPGQLSGGEMQRVAIARALINKPEILLADEPTGNLDTRRSHEIGQILLDLQHKQNLTVILVTHNPELAKIADRIIEIRDGEIYTGPDSLIQSHVHESKS